GSNAQMFTAIAFVRGSSLSAWAIMKQVIAPRLQPAMLIVRGRSMVAFSTAGAARQIGDRLIQILAVVRSATIVNGEHLGHVKSPFSFQSVVGWAGEA